MSVIGYKLQIDHIYDGNRRLVIDPPVIADVQIVGNKLITVDCDEMGYWAHWPLDQIIEEKLKQQMKDKLVERGKEE